MLSHLAMMILAQTLVPRTCSENTMKLGVTFVLILTVAFSCLVIKRVGYFYSLELNPD